MKRIFIILSAFAVLFTACETDFEVNADWEETIVVYGLLDASADTQYIKINKAYLGEGDAIMMAQYSDSINFNPNDLEVKLHKLGFNDTLMSITLDTTLIEKEDGLFAVDNNIIYRAVTSPGFLRDDKNYLLTIKNIKSGNKVSAITVVIDDFAFNSLANDFGFYNPHLVDSLKFIDKTIAWDKVTHGEIYQVDLRFNYKENNMLKSLIWSQPLEVVDGSDVMQSTISSVKFFNFLSSELEDSDFQGTRTFEDIDLVMTVGTADLNTYIKINEPVTGIAQQRPQFTNVNNGIGIFSSRFTYTIKKGLTDFTKNYLIDELDRNFQ